MSRNKTSDDPIVSTQKALQKAKLKYNTDPAKAKIFLRKMGYLDSEGRVKKPYQKAETSEVA